jgi:hypothetical protein
MTAKIVYLDFLISYTSKVASIIRIFKVLNLLKLSIVFYIVSCSSSGLVLNKKSVLDLGSSSLSIFL